MNTKYFDKNLLENAIKSSTSTAQVINKMSMKPSGSSYRSIKNAINKYNLDISHFTGQLWSKGIVLGFKHPIDDYLNGTRKINAHNLKNRLIAEKIKKHQCETCLIVEWNGEPAPIELHHIDGNKFNNQLSNLQILCPNCHAQTTNHAGKGKKKQYDIEYVKLGQPKIKITRKIYQCIYCDSPLKTKAEKCLDCSKIISRKVSRPTKETLEQEIIENSYLSLSKKYGVSDNAIRKWAKNYGISQDIIKKRK